MTYPKTGAGDACAGEPAVPGDRGPRPRVLGRRRHLPGEHRGPRRRTAPTARVGGNEFVFYDGPPFANGLPHYGHLLTGYVKDVVPRYQTMRGRRVERRFGWDCHGLPAEVEAEKQLGLTSKSQIEDMGVAAFNDACRASVLRYTKEWEAYVTRQARWVDFENDYKTLDLDYMESVMWAFKTLWDKGLVYEGFRVLAYCWRDETPLSNTETRMDDVYRQRQDPAVTVGFRLLDGPAAGALALIWTTTPWTLPSNLAMAVHPELEYVVLTGAPGTDQADERFLLAAERVGALRARARRRVARRRPREAGRVVARLTGAELLGTRYQPPFSFFARPGERAPGARRRLRHHRRRHRHGAHRARVRRGGQGRHATRPASRSSSRSTPAAGSPPRCRPTPGQLVFDANKAIIARPQGRHAAAATSPTARCCCGTRPTTTRTRTAGAAATR